MAIRLLEASHMTDMVRWMPDNNPLESRCHGCPTCDRRQEARLPCSDLVRVRWVDQLGARREEIVVVENHSASGASLFTGVPIREGVQVTLCGRDEDLLATVQHCVPAPNGYLAGVEFRAPSTRYVPEHLLDVARLIIPERP
jgi:hypothetical protein